MAQDAVKSQSITNFDTVPMVPNSAGQGAAGRFVTVDDWTAATATGLQSTGSYYKVVRIPTGAIVKSVILASDKAPETSTSVVVAFDMSLIFSDAASPIMDGTPSFLQGLIPTTANTGATTTIATYSSPNKIFGTAVPTSHTAGIAPIDEVFNGIGSTYNFSGITQQPLWQTFGFTDGRGNPADPGGYFDLLLYVATAAVTGQACNLYSRVSYVI